MRAFVLVEPNFFTPPEIFPTLVEGFVAWRDANRQHMESFEFFAGGGGVSASSMGLTRRPSTG
jgi:hypothetical protein